MINKYIIKDKKKYYYFNKNMIINIKKKFYCKLKKTIKKNKNGKVFLFFTNLKNFL